MKKLVLLFLLIPSLASAAGIEATWEYPTDWKTAGIEGFRVYESDMPYCAITADKVITDGQILKGSCDGSVMTKPVLAWTMTAYKGENESVKSTIFVQIKAPTKFILEVK